MSTCFSIAFPSFAFVLNKNPPFPFRVSRGTTSRVKQKNKQIFIAKILAIFVSSFGSSNSESFFQINNSNKWGTMHRMQADAVDHSVPLSGLKNKKFKTKKALQAFLVDVERNLRNSLSLFTRCRRR